LAKKKAAHMERSFSLEKRHYSLTCIPACTASNEKLWIFFGVHTVNAFRMATKIQKAETIPIKKAA